MRAAVYKNLNTGLWSVASVKETRNGFRKDKVIKHVSEITLDNVTFVVGAESTRQRILNGYREVYAYAVGDIVSYDADPANVTYNIHFNPYKSNDFHSLDDGDINGEGRQVEAILTNEQFKRAYFLVGQDSDNNEAYVL